MGKESPPREPGRPVFCTAHQPPNCLLPHSAQAERKGHTQSWSCAWSYAACMLRLQSLPALCYNGSTTSKGAPLCDRSCWPISRRSPRRSRPFWSLGTASARSCTPPAGSSWWTAGGCWKRASSSRSAPTPALPTSPGTGTTTWRWSISARAARPTWWTMPGAGRP